MSAIALCGLALILTFWAGKKSLSRGLVTLLGWGYLYGIIRANLPTTASHFIFDAALIGFYFSQRWSSPDAAEARRLSVLRMWTIALIAWPILISMIPTQPLLVSLVGLRGSIFFLPLLLVGARLKDNDLLELSFGLAALNLIALGFAGAEYFLGLESFYPVNPVTLIIYQSADAGPGFYRIPAIFTNAHAYGGAMLTSTPFLLGAWQRFETRKARLFALGGLLAAFLGILVSATRVNFIAGVFVILSIIVTGKMSFRQRFAFVALIALAAGVALSSDRFQRFKSLSDTEAVTERLNGSVNRGFFEILFEYPLGNGMGGGGTSMPYFLEGDVRNPIATENEYTRILCEQGVPGLLLWVGFVAWYVSRRKVAFAKGSWSSSRRAAFAMISFVLCTAWIGNGLLTAIPNTAMLILGLSWTAAPMLEATVSRSRMLMHERLFAPAGARVAEVR